jgi:hypothetical protein
MLVTACAKESYREPMKVCLHVIDIIVAGSRASRHITFACVYAK